MVTYYESEDFAPFENVKFEFDSFTREIDKLKCDIEMNERKIETFEFHESILQNAIESIQDSDLQSKLQTVQNEYRAQHTIDILRLNLTEMYSRKADLVLRVKSLFVYTETSVALCSVCLEKPVDTFLKMCGHTFCASCIGKNSKNSKCPQCRAVYSPMEVRGLIFS